MLLEKKYIIHEINEYVHQGSIGKSIVNLLSWLYQLRQSIFNMLKCTYIWINLAATRKTYYLACTYNDDLNQPGHQRSLIRDFFVRMKKLCIRGLSKLAQ